MCAMMTLSARIQLGLRAARCPEIAMPNLRFIPHILNQNIELSHNISDRPLHVTDSMDRMHEPDFSRDVFGRLRRHGTPLRASATPFRHFQHSPWTGRG